MALPLSGPSPDLPHPYPDHSLQIENLTWWTLAQDVLVGAKAGARVALGSDSRLPPQGVLEVGALGVALWPSPVSLLLPPPPGDGQIPRKHAFWARVCGFNAIVLMCVNIFFYAYFA